MAISAARSVERAELCCFQAFDNRLKIDAFTNPSNRGRYVHGPMRVIERVRFVAADICKRLNDFLSGNAGVQAEPLPISNRSLIWYGEPSDLGRSIVVG